MGNIHLVTGGSRSGKSDFARVTAEKISGIRTFIATCPVIDGEMDARIERHKKDRENGGWETIEEETKIAETIKDVSKSKVVLVDCLTLWINNLLFEAEKRGETIEEDDMTGICSEIIEACKARDGDFIFVTNEIGMGIIPDNSISRRYRDLVGRCNQAMAKGADRVTMVVSGLPITLK
jgi:adenosylcobinamide kinase / adenosylcobinamide-phosphate guanylyltransferase